MTRTARIALAGAATLLAMSTALVVTPGAAYAETVRGLQWYLGALHISSAQASSQGQGVTVAVIDSGVDATHPDLVGQVLPGYGLAGGAADGRRDSDTTGGHGTAMASLIAGKGGGEMHELGIAPKARILPIAAGLKVGSDNEALAIRWAVDHGAKVINISADAQAPPASAQRAAVEYALSHDVVVVAAAGNRAKGDRIVGAPASIPGVVAVSGSGRSGQFWDGSVSGPEVVVAAPGEQIIASAPAGTSPNGYFVADGTSNSAAIVSGVVALIRARYPNANAANVINRLIRTAQDLGPSGRDPQYGFGLIDPVAALTASVPDVTSNPLLAGSGSGTATPDQTAGAGGAQPAVQVSANWPILFGCLGVGLLVVVVVVVLIVRASRRRPPVQRPPVQPPPVYRPGPPPPRR